MKRPRAKANPPRNYVAYFSLCQAIAGQLEDAARRIARSGIHAPVFHDQIIADLQGTKGFCDRAMDAVNKAQSDWNLAARESASGEGE